MAFLGVQEAVGSNPAVPTTNKRVKAAHSAALSFYH